MLATRRVVLALLTVQLASFASSHLAERREHQHVARESELFASKEEVNNLRRMEKDLQLEIKAVNLYDRIRKSKLDNRNLGVRLDRLIRQSNTVLNQAVGADADRMLEEKVEGSKYAWQQCKDVGVMASSASTQEDYDNVCAFVKERCKPKDGLVNYVEIPYCWMPKATALAGVVLFLWILILFVWLMAMVDFLIPSLATMSRMCMLRQSVAGVTFLAIGNGSSDLFSMTAATLSGIKGMELAIGEVLGNGMLIFCGIQGLIAILTPFTANRGEYLRDCGFYLLSLALSTIILLDGQISTMEGIIFLIVYATYVVVVIYFEKILLVFGMEPLEEDVALATPNVVEEGEKEKSSLIQKDDELHEVLLRHFMPPSHARLEKMSWFEKVLVFIQIPVSTVMKLTVPVVDESLPEDGWSRSATTIQMFFLPIFLAWFISRHLYTNSPYRLLYTLVGMLVAAVIGAFVAYYIWSSTSNKRPAWHRSLAFAGFAAAVIWIYATAAEIVNVVLAFGVIFELGNVSLGISLLAIGIGMQDLVTNIGVARAGYPNMAASACVGAPLMNILMGLGCCAIFGNWLVHSPYPLHLTTQIIVCLAFLFSSVFVAVLYLNFTGFKADALFGTVLVACYVIFMVTSLALDSYADDSYLTFHVMGR
uniref:Sodium/calcium exchanger membrane region domain-containing protein n=1 Tax=Guillardia theta TaxID=55529 RepID=A0A7S4UQ24_GUITH|mmetsp:Transcript_42501/g.133872  ORF Transcript_42501/g.133872 Transcript_42501/m.133872 type:complete len:650 (+) Transcript_42501:220-2169(+)